VTTVWITIAVLAVGTFASKAVGTLVLGGSDLGPRAMNVTALVAPAILAALVVYETLGAHGGGITVDARAAGLGAAILAILAKAPMIVVILLAAAVTATLRAFT
jgi:branched-subunit amino acid transport protein